MANRPDNRKRRWVRLGLFAVVANPVTLIGTCAASLGMAEPGSLVEPDGVVIFETWTYRVRAPDTGDTIVAAHPDHGVDLVGPVVDRERDKLTIVGNFLPPGHSVSVRDTVTVERSDIDGRVIGSLGGSGDEDLAAIAVFAAPWVLGFIMLWVAIAWAERIRSRVEGSSRWFPLPLLLWGLGTAFYAWMTRNAAEQNHP